MKDGRKGNEKNSEIDCRLRRYERARERKRGKSRFKENIEIQEIGTRVKRGRLI